MKNCAEISANFLHIFIAFQRFSDISTRDKTDLMMYSSRKKKKPLNLHINSFYVPNMVSSNVFYINVFKTVYILFYTKMYK